jgi:hypothetical protein
MRCAPRIICPDWKGLGMQCIPLPGARAPGGAPALIPAVQAYLRTRSPVGYTNSRNFVYVTMIYVCR